MAGNGMKTRGVLNLGSVDLGKDLEARMKRCIENNHELRHVSILRRRAPWLRGVIAAGCDAQEKANGKGGK